MTTRSGGNANAQPNGPGNNPGATATATTEDKKDQPRVNQPTGARRPGVGNRPAPHPTDTGSAGRASGGRRPGGATRAGAGRPDRDDPNFQRQIQTMVKSAEELGCQLQVANRDAAVLQGLCPFHHTNAGEDTRSLTVDTGTGRFNCRTCGAGGTPNTFMARCWGVSARDAHVLMEENPEALTDRPAYPDSYFPSLSSAGAILPQNSAVLGKADQFYGEQLYTNYEPLEFLSNLGVRPAAADAVGVGYCPGAGLADRLADNGIYPALEDREIDNSPLFNELNGQERFAGRLTIADQDLTGGIIWMGSIALETPNNNSETYFRHQRPATYGIAGHKRYLVNVYGINRQDGECILTDDARLYILLRANELPVVLLTQRQRSAEMLNDMVVKSAAELRRRNVKRLAIATHNMGFRRGLHHAMMETLEAKDIQSYDKPFVLATLDRKTRDLAPYTDFPGGIYAITRREKQEEEGTWERPGRTRRDGSRRTSRSREEEDAARAEKKAAREAEAADEAEEAVADEPEAEERNTAPVVEATDTIEAEPKEPRRRRRAPKAEAEEPAPAEEEETAPPAEESEPAEDAEPQGADASAEEEPDEELEQAS